jgi:hypothetical protein
LETSKNSQQPNRDIPLDHQQLIATHFQNKMNLPMVSSLPGAILFLLKSRQLDRYKVLSRENPKLIIPSSYCTTHHSSYGSHTVALYLIHSCSASQPSYNNHKAKEAEEFPCRRIGFIIITGSNKLKSSKLNYAITGTKSKNSASRIKCGIKNWRYSSWDEISFNAEII